MTSTLLSERFAQVVTCTNTHIIHNYPPNQQPFADLVTAKLPLAQNAADIAAIINAYKVPSATSQTP